MMDVFRLITAHLRCEVCPVYTPCEVHEDACALAKALRLQVEVGNPDNLSPLCYFREEASSLLGLTGRKWAEMCEVVPCATGKGRKPQLLGGALRRKILLEHDNSPALWLSSVIGSAPWFAKLLLPLDHNNDLPVEELRSAWRQVARFPKSPALVEVILRFKGRITDGDSVVCELQGECAEAVYGWRELVHFIAHEVFKEGGYPVARALEALDVDEIAAMGGVRPGVVSRAGDLAHLAQFAEGFGAECARYVVSGDRDSDVRCDLLSSLELVERRELEAKAMALGIPSSDSISTLMLQEAVELQLLVRLHDVSRAAFSGRRRRKYGCDDGASSSSS